jgi:hypothetical protein
MITRGCLAWCVVFCLVAGPVQADSKPLELKWSELAPLISSHVVQLTLSTGGTVRGEVATVRDDSLVIDVRKSSDSKTYPKGSASVLRSSVTLIKVERAHGSWGRTIGTTLGVLTGLAIGGYAAGSTADSAGKAIPLFLVIAGAISVAGYFLGRSLDREVTTIRIVP